jgi:prophage regulatory protein
VGTKGRLYTTGDIADRLGVTRQRAYALSRQKGFPDPFDEWTNGLAVWLVDDVDAWFAAKRPELAEEPEGE